jgi:hypothetical protein
MWQFEGVILDQIALLFAGDLRLVEEMPGG